MASASLQDIKSRMKSVSSTMQMTKAMELVASSKLRRAKDLALRSRAYEAVLRDAIDDITAGADISESPWANGNSEKPRLYIVVAGDRGLAGGYNSNIFKLAESLAGENSIFLPIGRRAVEYYKRRDRAIFESVPLVSDMGVGDAIRLGERVARAFAEGSFSGVSLVYTEFLSMLSCQPREEKILPMNMKESASRIDPIYEGDMAEMLDKILPTYVGGMLNAAVLEASASEQSSRRNAMSSANKNAKEIIDTLSISYNRARQAAITQEITEIVSGAEAL